MVFERRLLAAVLCLLSLSSVERVMAQQTFPCQQLGPVAGSPRPSAGGSDVALVVGDHYWSCPCGQARKLVGDNEQRALVGDNEQRALVGDNEKRNIVGDNEQRNLVGDNEQRNLVGDNERRALVGDNEQRNLVGDNEQRHLVGDAGALQCRPDPQCGGFALIGSGAAIQVVTRAGLRSASASCVPAY